MAKPTFFSFHYQRDLWRVNQVRNSHIVEGKAAVGFSDASLWEEAKKKGDAVIKDLIDKALVGTSVTVVLIGAETANRKFVVYEIERSIARGYGLLGIHINHLKNQDGQTDFQGVVPATLIAARAPVYSYDYNRFGEWVEAAYKKAHPNGV